MNNLSVKTVCQFVVQLDNVPGTLAQITQACAIAGVNFEGFFQTVHKSKEDGSVHFVTEQKEEAREVLRSLDKSYSEEKIISLQYSDKPGVVANVAQVFAYEEINIEGMYVSTPGDSKETILYLRVSESDLDRAIEAAKNL